MTTDIEVKLPSPPPIEETMSPMDLKLCFSLLSSIKKHNSALPFLNPVSAALVPDYYNIITEPVDLSTMTVNLSNQQYKNPRDLLLDLQLLFKNCFVYNERGSPVYQEGKNLFEYVHKKVSDFFPEYLELFEEDKPRRNVKPIPVYMLDDGKEPETVDTEISDLQSSLESIQKQLEMLEGNKELDYLSDSDPSDLEEILEDRKSRIKKERVNHNTPKKPVVKRLRSTPIHEGYRCEYCQCSETPMWIGGPSGPRTLCNRCGVKCNLYKFKQNVFTLYRESRKNYE